MFHANVNINLMVDYVVRFKIGIKINFGASVKIKKTSCARKRFYMKSYYMQWQKW